eukprot:scaffold16717_cov96-Skeletonema_dohrnii-CCMP3373.AAC.1
MPVTTADSAFVECNIPQDEGESTLRVSTDAFVKQRRLAASKLEPTAVGVGHEEDPISKTARRCCNIPDGLIRGAA